MPKEMTRTVAADGDSVKYTTQEPRQTAALFRMVLP
jgi:hypothetical protein